MNLLANENFPGKAVEALRAEGHDVLWARTDMAGAEDEAILSRARTESRVVITFDKDFGELAYRLGMPATCGVILFRFALSSPEFAANRAVAVLQSRNDWQGNFAVVDEYRVRMRSLP
jgi:predicted nuclease of predicted toxin-antitoxin system